MHRHLAWHPDPDGGHLPAFGPHSGQSRLGPALHPELGQGRDQHLLQRPDIGDDALGVVQFDDRVADQLPGAVESDVAPPVDVVDLGSRRRHRRPVGEQVGGVPVAADREHRWVLHQKQVVVAGATPDPALVQPALEVPGLGVGEATQPPGAQ